MQEFVEAYPKVSSISLFTIVQEIIGGFKNLHLNIDEAEKKEESEENFFAANNRSRGLSIIQHEKAKDEGLKEL